MGPIKTTIVGSLPKPEWLADPEQLRAPWRQDGSALAEAQDDAVALWLNAQEKAGLDIICDGEQRRRHYIWGFIEKLGKVDFENPAKKTKPRPTLFGRNSSPSRAGRVELD